MKKHFIFSRYGQFAAAMTFFVLLAAAVLLYWRNEYRFRKAHAAAERTDSLPYLTQKVRQCRNVRSIEADEYRTKLFRELVYFQKNYDAALPVLTDLAQYGMTAEIRTDAMFSCGHILLWQKQDPDQAAVWFRKYLLQKEGTPEQKQEAAFYLGVWHLQHNRRDEAVSALRFVLQNGPESRLKQRAAAMLGQGGR